MPASVSAVILAAGSGSRLATVSDGRPKALTPIAGRSLLARTLDALAARDIADIVIVTGHRGEDVAAVAATHALAARTRIVHVAEFATTNNIVSLDRALREHPEGADLLLLECDVLFEASLLDGLVEDGAPCRALLAPWRPGLDGTVASVADGWVTQLLLGEDQEADLPLQSYWKTVNLYRFDAATVAELLRPALREAAAAWPQAYYERVLRDLVADGTMALRAVSTGSTRWIEVDDPNDLRAAEFMAAPARRKAMLEEQFGGAWGLSIVDFASIANVRFPTPRMHAAMRAALPQLLGSYGSRQSLLDAKLALALGTEPAHTIAVHGASQAFPWLMRALGTQRACVPTPSFGEYERWFGDAATYHDAGSPVELAAVASDCDLLVVVSPNNPTGTVTSSAAIAALARARPSLRILVDESFLDFCEEPSLATADAAPNILVLKSLGKSWGVPGLRLGALHTTDLALAARLRSEVPIWNLSALGEFLLELVPKERRALRDSYARTKEDRAAFAAALAGLRGVAEVYPSGGNFLLVRLAEPHHGSAVVEALVAGHDCYVRDLSHRFADGRHLRIAVRLPAENARLLAALADVLSSSREGGS